MEKKFDKSMLEGAKQEIREQIKIDPNYVLAMQKTKNNPFLRNMVETLNSDVPINNEILAKAKMISDRIEKKPITAQPTTVNGYTDMYSQQISKFEESMNALKQPTPISNQYKQIISEDNDITKKQSLRNELLNMFTEDFVIKIIESYIESSPNFEEKIIDIVKNKFSKKK